MEKQNAVIVSTSTKYNINMGKSNEEQKEVVHSDDGVDEVPPLYFRESEELEKDPEEESYEELEEDPEEESYEELVEDPEEESYEELEEDPEEDSNEELDDDPEEESNEGLEDDPEGKSNKEPEEESIEELEEDPEEESNGELEEDPEEQSNGELEEDPEEPSSEVGPEEEEHGEEPADRPKEKPCMEHCKSLSSHNDNRTEDPLEVCLSKHRFTDKSEYVLAVAPIANNSNDKKRTMHVVAADSTPLQNCQSRKKYRQDKSPELKAECSSATSDKDECASQQQEKTGSSGKRRRSRWDLQPERDGKTEEDGKTSKRRRTKWVTDDSQSKMLGPLQLPDFKKACVPDYEPSSEFQKLKAKILEINQLLQKPELQNQNPVYDHLRTELIDERQRIISMLIKKNSTFQPPGDKPSKFCKKLYLPVNEYPGYNFTGRIVGHRGNTIKTMEKETGAKILLRGKGCMTLEKSASVNEDLHVYIKADSRTSLDAAVAMVEKLLIPIDEGKNAQERAQQVELPKHNGSLIKEKAHERARLEEHANMKRALIKVNACKVCGEKGHRDYACPDQQSTFKTTVSCSICGCNSHLTANCPLKSYSPLSNSIRDTKIKPSKEIDEANLYVGYLPSFMDEHHLKEVFCPFGKLTEARVIKDRTTGISKGYGFVKFENASDAAAAIAHLNDYVMDGKMLAVRVAGQPSVADACFKQYHGPSPNVKSQGTKPGSLLPEQASCPRPTMLSPSIYPGHRDLLPQTKAFDWTPSFSNPYGFSVFSSPTALFPGGTDFPGSQFQPCLMTPPPALHLGLTPGSGLDSISWPGVRGTHYYPLCRGQNQH